MNTDWIAADWPAPVGVIAGTTLRDSQFELPAEPQWLNQVHGTQVVRWDGTDDDGAEVPGGVYLYQVEAGSERARGKVVVVR